MLYQMWLSEQKPAMFALNCKYILLVQVVAIPNRHAHITASLAKMKWSAFLEDGSVTLWFDDGSIGACGVHQLGVMDHEFFPRPVCHLLGLVAWLKPCVDNLWHHISSKQYLEDLWASLSLPPPHPPLPSSYLTTLAQSRGIQVKKPFEKAKNPARIFFKARLTVL